MRLSTACCGLSNSFCADGEAAASDFDGGAACKAGARAEINIAEAMNQIFDEAITFDRIAFPFIDLSTTSSAAPLSASKPKPPPPILWAPLVLLARVVPPPP